MLKEHIVMVGAWVFSIHLLTHYKSRLPLVTEIFFVLPLECKNIKHGKFT
jgi:hypothetical protein